MKIAHRQKLGTLLLKPLGLGQGLALGAVAVTAGVVARVLKAARVALLTTWLCALAADHRHHLLTY